MTCSYWIFKLSCLSTTNFQQLINYSSGVPTQGLVPVVISNSKSLLLNVSLDNLKLCLLQENIQFCY